MLFIQTQKIKEPIMQNITLTIVGMTCQGCANGVSRALKSVAGVDQVQVDLAAHRAEVAFDATQTNTAALIEAVEDAGFDASL